GGWGPISTPTLLSSGRMEPRKVVGTVDTSEFIVALSASVGFLIALSFAEVPWGIVGALLIGGLIAAPVAAWVVRILPMRVLGTAVGGVILITNMKTFLEAIGVTGVLTYVIYVVIVAVWVAALVHSIVINRYEKRIAEKDQPV
ncbi:MAG TPA: sulfite exporter TauE/SafE family protein, partial [Rubrobacteraceae bacterium]|nr:sulfite exporter TauE/SafE family protein [Rubrobacteraceae bacterium]